MEDIYRIKLDFDLDVDENMKKQENSRNLAIILLVFSLLSVLFSLMICVFYFKYRNLRDHFPPKLIFLLALLDIFCWGNTTITTIYVLTTGSSFSELGKGVCYTFAFIWNFSELLNFGVTFVIIICLYLAFIRNIDPAIYQKHMFISLLLYGLVLSIIPLFIQNGNDPISYGDVDGIKCWISHKYLKLYAFYIPLWVICVGNIALMVSFYTGLQNEIYGDHAQEFQTNYILFPTILIICYLPGSIRRIFDLYNYDPEFLQYLMYILMPLQGVFNAFAYGTVDRFVNSRLRALFSCNLQLLNEENLEPVPAEANS